MVYRYWDTIRVKVLLCMGDGVWDIMVMGMNDMDLSVSQLPGLGGCLVERCKEPQIQGIHTSLTL